MLELRGQRYVDDMPKVMHVKDTLRRALPIARSIGVTRLADITHMDMLRIPNYSAVLPGTDDYIWVYSGKGPSRDHAKASAVMESIERYSALASVFFNRCTGSRRVVRGSMVEMIREHGREHVLHPDDVVEAVSPNYTDGMRMDFIEGYDLISRERILVPAGLVLTRYDIVASRSGVLNPFLYSHSNGLASGNSIEEAILQALCEVVERDAVSIAELRSSVLHFHVLKSSIQRLRMHGLRLMDIDHHYVDDPNLYPEVDLSGVDDPYARYLISRFEQEGIPLLVKDITSDIGVPTFIATSIQWVTHDYGYLAEGHGTHPNKDVALIRAITEVSQTRAANIQGARDDLRRMNYEMGNTAENKAWQFMHSNRSVGYGSIRDRKSSDVLDDIEFVLGRLKGSGLDRVIVANLTDERLGIPVVRVIVPGLETFKVSRSVIGSRAMRYMGKGGMGIDAE
ncbi:MAG: YcaO-like family protein [Candidatus Nitrosocaldus sp.]|nr:YcaO-like family protein [Candidatus Nitrosocaldus sp.]MDW7999849.1 YcaO-like family protein [Candidatus Nitrosocaldus sp.]